MTQTDSVIDWLRVVCSALSARQLYRGDHPRVRDALASIESASQRVLGDAEHASLFMIEGRLVCNDETIAGAGPLADKVFGALAACGHDRLTILPGITSAELDGFVSALATPGRDGERPPLRSTPHLRLSVLDAPRAASSARGSAGGSAIDAGLVASLWATIDSARVLDGDLLERTLTPLLHVVASSDSDGLPLASASHHDAYTSIHIANVAVLTMALAEAAGVPESGLRQIGVAALLHDIGKTKIPASILNGSGRLSPSDLALVRQHPEIGARMLMATPGMPPLAAIVAFEHHVQADGGGYPDVPAGWRVNPASAMTHIADVYDALRSDRPYRAALDHDTIRTLMIRDRGTVFVPELLDAFFDEIVPRTDAVVA